MISVNIEE